MDAGIYLHIPYCASRCNYCDFNTYTFDQISDAERPDIYVQHLVKEIRFYCSQFSPITITSIFFGGGTPTLLKPEQLSEIIAVVKASATGVQTSGQTSAQASGVQGSEARAVEITVEANPDSIAPGYVQALADSGVNRLSLGMQSANLATLRALGRTHSVEQVFDAVKEAKACGLQVSLDLIYGGPKFTLTETDTLTEVGGSAESGPSAEVGGSPGLGTLDQVAVSAKSGPSAEVGAPTNSTPSAEADLSPETLRDWERSLTTAIAFEPDHISAYALTLEPNVPLYRKFQPDPDLQAEMYQLAEKTLVAAGFHNYEISNWAKPGCESRHNLNYWHQGNWLGFGAGAHSAVGRERWSNPRTIAAYFRTVNQLSAAGSQPNLEVLSTREFRNEQIMLGIRTHRGIIVSETECERLANYSELINIRPAESAPPELKAIPSTNQPQYWLTLNPHGRLLADTIIRALIAS